MTEPPWHVAAPLDQLRRYRLLRVEIEGRKVVLAAWREQVYALDNSCYHSGGPLDEGEIQEIEELGKRPCVVCPWHHYTIALDTGEGISRHVDPFRVPRRETVQSKGVKQRSHRAKIENGQVLVQLNLDGPELPSDYYSSGAFKRLMAGGGQTSQRYDALVQQQAQAAQAAQQPPPPPRD